MISNGGKWETNDFFPFNIFHRKWHPSSTSNQRQEKRQVKYLIPNLLLFFLFEIVIFWDYDFILHKQYSPKMEWNSQELQLLHTFKNSERRNNWKNLTKQLEIQGFTKNQMECKRKWMQLYNEDPNDSTWTQDELRTLFTLYHTYNSQWSNIHKSISSKNKIQIRNKFYGTLRNMIRFLLEYFNFYYPVQVNWVMGFPTQPSDYPY